MYPKGEEHGVFMCRMPIEILTGVNVSTLLPAWAVGGGGRGMHGLGSMRVLR